MIQPVFNCCLRLLFAVNSRLQLQVWKLIIITLTYVIVVLILFLKPFKNFMSYDY